MSPLLFYIVTILVFTGINGIAVLGFNLQFGFAGILNLGILIPLAAGAYGTAVAALPPASNGSFTQYVGGFNWAFPWDVLFGVVCAAVVSFVLGFVALRRLRDDYLAITLVAILQGLQLIATNDTSLFNGGYGMPNVPGPWAGLSSAGFQYAFLAFTAALLIGTVWLLSRLTRAPLGRALRGIREDEVVAESLGRNTWRLKMVAFVIGGAVVGLSGGLIVLYTNAWGTQGWQIGESLTMLAAIFIGGSGRHFGVLVGALFVAIVTQGSTFLPQIGSVSLLPQLQGALLGFVLLAMLWFRPQGIFPEKRDRFEEFEHSIEGEKTSSFGMGTVGWEAEP